MIVRGKWPLALLGGASVLLVPWMAVLAVTLPGSTRVDNWPLAWIGLDVLLAAGCATTAVLGLRGDARARLTASATASVAVLDAWFDITTSGTGAPLTEALLCAVAEAGLAGACVMLALGRAQRAERAHRAQRHRGSACAPGAARQPVSVPTTRTGLIRITTRVTSGGSSRYS
ncbi:hypothetical protein BFF78_16200 [Streptomyces fodineus]|uniref:Uncharacterized protein n=1 Tax=Streptomyces fodineus TaxID=1904616 RepID=A0A1D7Y9V2_9ACTN|nr:hypothetical protein [Streptomyces fodineus]AOR32405.1 hypothetical protein BFF78_16200 [Streptomyces fodineus]